MSLLEKIFKSCREPDEPTEDPKEDFEEPQPEQWDFQVLVKLLFGGCRTYEDVVAVRHHDQEQARLEGYYRVADQFGQQVVYGEADVIRKDKVGGSDDV